MRLGTIARASEVLRLFSQERPDWGVTEVATALGIPKSNAHDLLSSLAAAGLLQHTARSRYALGWRLLSMSRTVRSSALLQRAAYPELRRLHRRFGGPVGIAAWDGDIVVMLGMLAGPTDSDPKPSAVGLALPAHATALGKVLLAERCRDIASLGFVDVERLTARTLTSADALMQEIVEVRRRGFASAVGEVAHEMSALAAPVRDQRGAVIAAVGVGTDTDGYAAREEQLRTAIMGCAARISRQLADPAHGRGRPPVET